MCIYICLDILADKVNPKDWEKVYQESLKLIEKYPFMQVYDGQKKYKISNFYYYDYAKEYIDENGNYLWSVCGNIDLLEEAGTFSLYKDVSFYYTKKKSNINDIFERSFDASENIGISKVFYSATNGFDYQNYILAIACLIVSRFPKYTQLYGDISIEQINSAVKWVNQYLEIPISAPDTTDKDKLFKRLCKISSDKVWIYQAFRKYSLNSFYAPETGKFIRDNFDKKIYYNDFFKRFKLYDFSTIGFYKEFNQFLSMGFSVEMLCDICILDRCKPITDVESFIKYLLKSRITEEKNYEYVEAEDIKISKIIRMVSDAFNKNVKRYIPIENFRQILNSKFKNICNVNEIIDNNIYLANLETIYEQEKCKKIIEDSSFLVEEIIDCDISVASYLILYEYGDKISSYLKKLLINLKNDMDNLISETQNDLKKLWNLEHSIKIKAFINTLKKHFIIPLDSLEITFKKFNNEKLFNQYMTLISLGDFYNIKVSDDIEKFRKDDINEIIKALIINENLFEAFINKEF